MKNYTKTNIGNEGRIELHEKLSLTVFHEFHVFISQVKAVINLSYAGTDRKYHVFHVIFYSV